MIQKKVGVIGARSMVGRYLLDRLTHNEFNTIAFSRQNYAFHDHINCRTIKVSQLQNLQSPNNETIDLWVFLAPIKSLPSYFKFIESYQPKRVVAISSTSCFTKQNSQDRSEREEASNILNAEITFQKWAENKGIEWVLLRPTLIYSIGEDKNISSMMRLIKTLQFFPIIGKANGLRQPVHADDVAAAAFEALLSEKASRKCYNITGGEILTYREMVSRIFIKMNKKPKFLQVPFFLFNMLISICRFLPSKSYLTLGMVLRMNTNQIFDHKEASRDLNYRPRGFSLTPDIT